jgi:TonB family protein
VLRVLVGSDGLVKRIAIAKGLPDGLNEEAVRAAQQLRFKPAMKGGQQVAYWQTVEMSFVLGK